MAKSFYITTTLPYVNAPLHMGHALEFVRADTIARYKKLVGYDVFFNTGTDEHGVTIYNKTKEAGEDPQVFVDAGFETFRGQLKMFGVSDDVHFIRTTDKNHEAGAQEFWRKVAENGYIYKDKYEAKYCVGCESEKTDSDLDENGECPEHPGRPLETISEENYFFKYSAFTDKLTEFYDKNPNFVVPEFRFNEMKNFVKSGLQDFSISRLKSKMPWGIPVPDDPEHVMYVWFDALTNYINTLDWINNKEQFEKYWTRGNPTQYCGKDNTRFQGAMWQAMLMAGGFPNSHQIVVNGFVTADGGVKMSKTLGNVVDPRGIVEEYSTDALRYFLLREISSFEDSPFTIERFKDAYNSGLANGLGNLVSRVMTMAVNYGVIWKDYLGENEIAENFHGYPGVWDSAYNSFDLKKVMDNLWENFDESVGALNVYIQNTEPYKKIKTDEAQAKKDIAFVLSHLLRFAHQLEPLLPETAKKIQRLVIENKKPKEPLFLRKD